MKAILLAVTALALATPAFADADGPDAWRVTGVASNDVLNTRIGPGTDYQVIEALPFNARGVQQVVCVPTITREQFFALSETQQSSFGAGHTRWCLVEWNGRQVGWVNAGFLAEDS